MILRNAVAGSVVGFFQRSWVQFQQEFGTPTSQYWIGLEWMHALLSQGRCGVRFDIQLLNGSWHFAQYSTFMIDSAANHYKLTMSGYSGSLSDGLIYSNGWGFTTYDVDNDPWSGNCPSIYGGGFWYGHGGGDWCGCARITANSRFFWKDPTTGGWYDYKTVEARLFCL